MFFKNALVYCLTDTPENLTELETLLAELPFRECGQQELKTMGWCSPFGSESLCHTAEGRIWLTLKSQERLLPSHVVNAELDKKVAAIESETGAPLGKKAKQDIKHELIHQLLPNAFTRDKHLHGYIDIKKGLIVIDTATPTQAETWLAMLRKCLGSLPCIPLARQSYAPELTNWLFENALPEGIEILEEVRLESNVEGTPTAILKNDDLDSEAARAHYQAGKQVSFLAIKWDDTLTVKITRDLTLKSIRFADVLREQNDDIPKDQQAARMDADFVLMSGELSRFLSFLIEALNINEA